MVHACVVDVNGTFYGQHEVNAMAISNDGMLASCLI